MAFAWSLPTGFETPITYFYVMYFAVLLAHRQHRDDENCAKKFVFFIIPPSVILAPYHYFYRYGKDWDTYKKMVPYRIIPYVY